MLQFSMKFPKGFSNLYNRIASTKKGREFLKIEGIDRDRLDLPSMSKQYFTQDTADMSIDANANANGKYDKNLNNYMSEVVKGQLKLQGYYLLHRELEKEHGLEKADELLIKVINGDLYFHDSTAIQVHYCYAYSTSRLMIEGRTWGQLKSAPPKRLRSFISQVIETTMDLSQEQAGAAAIGDFLVNVSYYTKKENLSDKEIENEMQNFVHIMNNKFRTSGQSPFTNISIFCRNNIKALFDGYLFPDMSTIDIDEIMRVQEIFMKFFTKGDPITGEPYRFPVVTATFLEDKEKGIKRDEEFFNLIAKYNFEKGLMNIYGAKSVGKIASCCRLVNDLDLLGGDSFGNGGLNIGSHRVVTLNLPRLALYAKERYLSNSQFFKLLNSYLEDARLLLKAHRNLLHKRANKGFLKFIKPLNYINIDQHLFSTIGINGMYEMMHFLNDGDLKDGKHLKKNIIRKEKKIIAYINNKTKEWTQEDNLPYNVEQVPAESLAPKNAKKDKIMFGDEIQPFELYSNQFVPLSENYDIFDRIKLEGEFFAELSGGGITHINLNEPLKTKEDMKKLMEFAFNNGNEHFAINYNFNCCKNGHTTIGSNNESICPICNEVIEKRLTRVIGYFTETTDWNKTRRDNYNKRVFK